MVDPLYLLLYRLEKKTFFYGCGQRSFGPNLTLESERASHDL